MSLESILGGGEADRLRSATDAAFRTVDGEDILVLKLTRQDKPESVEHVSIGVHEGQLAIAPASSLVIGDAQARKRLSRGQDGRLQVLGKGLATDGWFNDSFPMRFERSEQSHQVMVMMRDGSRRAVQVKPVLSAAPRASVGEFAWRDGQLQWQNGGAVLGVPAVGAALSADQWKSVMPVGRGRFYSVDAVGQLWWWGEPGAAKRTHVTLPKTRVAESLAIAVEGGENEVVVLGTGGSFLCVVVDGKAIAEQSSREHCAGPGLRNGALGSVQWRRAKAGMELFERMKTGDGTSEDVVLEAGPGGLDTDRPRGLCQIPDAPGVWFDPRIRWHLPSDGQYCTDPIPGVARPPKLWPRSEVGRRYPSTRIDKAVRWRDESSAQAETSLPSSAS